MNYKCNEKITQYQIMSNITTSKYQETPKRSIKTNKLINV